jgi:putative transposase
MESFNSLYEAQLLLDDWRREYNHYRPHQSLDYETPAEFACRWRRGRPVIRARLYSARGR